MEETEDPKDEAIAWAAALVDEIDFFIKTQSLWLVSVPHDRPSVIKARDQLMHKVGKTRDALSEIGISNPPFDRSEGPLL